MKWNFRSVLIVVVLLVNCTPCFSKSDHVISGLEAAKHYNGKSGGKLYIRTGSFTNQANAIRYEAYITSRTRYPVRLSHKHGFYIVTVGPITTASEARKVASNIHPEIKQSYAKSGKNTHAFVHLADSQLTASSNTPQAAKATKAIKSVKAKQAKKTKKTTLKPQTTTLPKALEVITPAAATTASRPVISLTTTATPGKYFGAAGRFFLNVSAGGSVFNLGHTHYVIFPPSSFRTDSFYIGGYPLTYDVAAGIGYNMDTTSTSKIGSVLHDVSLGLNVYYSPTTRKGSVLEYGLPAFANSNYNLQVNSGRLMLDSEWDFYPLWNTVMPFVEVGLGASRNTLFFKNSPIPVVGVSGGYYALPDNSQFQFAWQLGAGLKYELNENVILTARYLYANAGMASSSTYDATSGVNLGKPISVLVQSQTALFGINYLIG